VCIKGIDVPTDDERRYKARFTLGNKLAFDGKHWVRLVDLGRQRLKFRQQPHKPHDCRHPRVIAPSRTFTGLSSSALVLLVPTFGMSNATRQERVVLDTLIPPVRRSVFQGETKKLVDGGLVPAEQRQRIKKAMRDLSDQNAETPTRV